MNKSQLIDKIAAEVDVSKAVAGKLVDSFVNIIIKTVKSGDSLSLVGFGTFQRQSYNAKRGVNPATGEKITIAARKAPKFKAGKKFKDIVNNK